MKKDNLPNLIESDDKDRQGHALWLTLAVMQSLDNMAQWHQFRGDIVYSEDWGLMHITLRYHDVYTAVVPFKIKPDALARIVDEDDFNAIESAIRRAHLMLKRDEEIAYMEIL